MQLCGILGGGTGCGECMNTGFKGRSAVTELLVSDEILRDAVLQKMPTRALQEVAIRQGMQTMWQNGLRRVTACSIMAPCSGRPGGRRRRYCYAPRSEFP